jgi:hypothetical protein
MQRKLALALVMSLAVSFIMAQSPAFNSIYWGTHLRDNVSFPSFNYANTELVDEIAVGDEGSVYVVGQSFAPPKTNIDVCSGTQTFKLGSGDGFLAKYDECGNLVWSTFFGDYAQCLALDKEAGSTVIFIAGKITVQGANGPAAFACDGNAAGIFQPGNDDNSESFIAKFRDEGSSVSLLRWTYLGGTNINSISGSENILGLDVWEHGLLVAGNSTSTDLHKGAVQKGDTTYASGGGDAFFAEFDSLLSSMKYFTYVGAGGNDRFHDVKKFEETSGNVSVYLSGTTSSSNQISSGSGFDLSFNGDTDAFVQKWEDADGNGSWTKTWGTYVGGTGGEHSRAMALDKDENIFLTGYTQSTDLPVTSLAYDPIFGADGSASTSADAYVIKLNRDGGNEWCTYFGGKKEETANGLVVFRRMGVQYVAITGLTKAASNFFPLVNPIQQLLNGNDNNQFHDVYYALLTDVTSTQQQLLGSSYLGGSNAEGVQTGLSYHPSLAVGPNKELYVAVATKSNDIAGVVGNEFNNLVEPFIGGSDAFIFKLADSTNLNQTGCNFFSERNEKTNSVEEVKGKLFPNPSGSVATFSFHSLKAGQAMLEVKDEVGALILRRSVQIAEGENQMRLDITGLSSGVYFIQLAHSDCVYVERLLKQ